MKFEIPASQRNLKITKTALALSGIADTETYEVFTTPNAVVVIDGQMTAKELFSAAASLRLLASDLLMQLAKSCDDVCDDHRNCEFCVGSHPAVLDGFITEYRKAAEEQRQDFKLDL